MLKNRRAFWIWLLLIVLTALMIFRGSSMPYEEQNIQPFLRAHFEWTSETFPHIDFMYDGDRVTTQDPYAFFEFVIRKTSHVIEYFLLTFMLLNLFLSTVMPRLLSYLCGPAVAINYAMFDEWHQTFVPGRNGHFVDAFTFDLAGMILAVLLLLSLDIYYLWFYTETSKKNTEKM